MKVGVVRHVMPYGSERADTGRKQACARALDAYCTFVLVSTHVQYSIAVTIETAKYISHFGSLFHLISSLKLRCTDIVLNILAASASS